MGFRRRIAFFNGPFNAYEAVRPSRSELKHAILNPQGLDIRKLW